MSYMDILRKRIIFNKIRILLENTVQPIVRNLPDFYLKPEDNYWEGSGEKGIYYCTYSLKNDQLNKIDGSYPISYGARIGEGCSEPFFVCLHRDICRNNPKEWNYFPISFDNVAPDNYEDEMVKQVTSILENNLIKENLKPSEQ